MVSTHFNVLRYEGCPKGGLFIFDGDQIDVSPPGLLISSRPSQKRESVVLFRFNPVLFDF